jgi:hypothetical protein
MRTIETTAVVTPEHTLTVQLPADVAPGTHKVVVVIEEVEAAPKPPVPRWIDWPAHNVQLTDPTCTFRREDMYGDDGR